MVTFYDINVCYIQTKSVRIEPNYKKGYYRKSMFIIMEIRAQFLGIVYIKHIFFSLGYGFVLLIAENRKILYIYSGENESSRLKH